jgi:ABC-type antimicrobial peptide transport system permease subunit
MIVRQDFRENLILALDTVRAHKLRSFLTVLGVVVGVSIIIVVAALLAGFDSSVTEAFTGYGADTAFVSKFTQGPHFGRLSSEERMRKPLTLEDGEAILAECPGVKAVAISHFTDSPNNSIRVGDKEVVGIDFRGVFPAFVQVYANAAIKEGRIFTDAENRHGVHAVVVGENIATALFPTVDAVGKKVLINGTEFTIIGVFELPIGGFGGNNEDRRVLIPYYTFRKLYPNAREHGIRFEAYPNQLDNAVDQVRELLRRRRNVKYSEPDSFDISTSQQALDEFNNIVSAVAIAIVVLSSIGLLIGGVGVMNIMLVSVTERTREIGVRKAIGARRRDITWQFLFEAMTLTGLGGVLGVVLGSSAAFAVRAATAMRAVVPIWSVVIGLAVAIAVGLVFGVWPALKASRLEPVEALRYE